MEEAELEEAEVEEAVDAALPAAAVAAAEAAAGAAAAAALTRSGFLRGCRVTLFSSSGLSRWKCGWCHWPGLVFLKLYALRARTQDEYCSA